MLRQNMNMNMNQKQLLQWINEVSFAVTEMVLYLDTHPDDADAHAYFDHFREERKKAMALYSENFAPLTLDTMPNADPCDQWSWASEPWPWEGGIC